ncbi:unnamed protein product [Peniophora sp. CBMAI 1063]|nr:unnamed protein product [Peniophora sp. CBMAI 1063]
MDSATASATTHTLVHSGLTPVPSSILKCTAVRCIAGKTFFDLHNPDGLLSTIEYIAGNVLEKGDMVRSMPIPSKLDRVLALCAAYVSMEAGTDN